MPAKTVHKPKYIDNTFRSYDRNKTQKEGQKEAPSQHICSCMTFKPARQLNDLTG
jgi:hypothetical protein